MKKPSAKPRRKPALRRGTIRKVIETPDVLAFLDVPVVFYPSEPDEPYLEAKTVKFLAEARRRAKAGDTAWLKKQKAEVFVGSPTA
jgi:hypothetical protein